MDNDLLNIITYELLLKDEKCETLYNIVHQVRPKKGQLLSLFTFSAFIIVFLFYFQYNQLLAYFVLLLFLFWYSRSDISIFSKRYKGHESQKNNCFTDAQNLVLKGKYKKAKEVLDLYINKFNDKEAMILYNFLCFVEGEFKQFNSNLEYIHDYDHDGFTLLIGISKIIAQRYKEGISNLKTVEHVSNTLELIKNYYLAVAYFNLNEIDKCQNLCQEIIHANSLKVVIEQHARELLERSKVI